MATKKEMVKEILSIKDIDTESNLMAKTSKELESILKDLKDDSKPVITNVVNQSIDIEAIKAELEAKLREELKAELEQKQTQNTERKKELKEAPPKRVEIDRFEQIPVMNCTNGKLIYISKKTGAEFVWTDYGDVEYLEMQELISMRSGSKDFLSFPYIIVLDDNAVNYLGLTKMYENLTNLENIEDIFELRINDFKEIVDNAPKGLIHTIVTKARQMHDNGELDSISKIKYLNEKFGTDIGQRG